MLCKKLKVHDDNSRERGLRIICSLVAETGQHDAEIENAGDIEGDDLGDVGEFTNDEH